MERILYFVAGLLSPIVVIGIVFLVKKIKSIRQKKKKQDDPALEENVKIVLTSAGAYWLEDKDLYFAALNGFEPDFENAEKIDMMEVETSKLSFLMDVIFHLQNTEPKEEDW